MKIQEKLLKLVLQELARDPENEGWRLQLLRLVSTIKINEKKKCRVSSCNAFINVPVGLKNKWISIGTEEITIKEMDAVATPEDANNQMIKLLEKLSDIDRQEMVYHVDEYCLNNCSLFTKILTSNLLKFAAGGAGGAVLFSTAVPKIRSRRELTFFLLQALLGNSKMEQLFRNTDGNSILQTKKHCVSRSRDWPKRLRRKTKRKSSEHFPILHNFWLTIYK